MAIPLGIVLIIQRSIVILVGLIRSHRHNQAWPNAYIISLARSRAPAANAQQPAGNVATVSDCCDGRHLAARGIVGGADSDPSTMSMPPERFWGRQKLFGETNQGCFQKEYNDNHLATPHCKAKRKDNQRRYGASPARQCQGGIVRGQSPSTPAPQGPGRKSRMPPRTAKPKGNRTTGGTGSLRTARQRRRTSGSTGPPRTAMPRIKSTMPSAEQPRTASLGIKMIAPRTAIITKRGLRPTRKSTIGSPWPPRTARQMVKSTRPIAKLIRWPNVNARDGCSSYHCIPATVVADTQMYPCDGGTVRPATSVATSSSGRSR
ncbi:hypothetical protein N9L68_04305 [bacterium]|nr:hypothetical protein [bacterium]